MKKQIKPDKIKWSGKELQRKVYKEAKSSLALLI
jgi:hypothetical protein